MRILESSEDYLEAMLMMQERFGYIRSIDIANELNVTKPSVSYATKRLRQNGYITMDKEGLITLTESGLAIAERVYERHKTLPSFFMKLGVDEETALEERVQAYEKKQGCQDTEGQDKLRTEEVLHDVSLTLRRGEKLAIVGYNGAGKTTLIKLVMRLYDPTSGRILYNGQDIREFDLADYRAHIGAVFQDYCLFAATVAENVMGGRYDASPESEAAVRKALDSASFTERLATLEKGLDTPLTRELDENGVNLSGGEAQKIAIARVFVRPYELIIMDEPSSALDPVAEYELNHSILNAADRQDRTVIFISHRLSTTRFADRILLFANGCLRESGSHDRLMELNGLYAEMFRMQAEKYRRGEEQETA